LIIIITETEYKTQTFSIGRRCRESCHTEWSKRSICDVSAESSLSSGTTSSRMLHWPPHLAWTVSST